MLVKDLLYAMQHRLGSFWKLDSTAFSKTIQYFATKIRNAGHFKGNSVGHEPHGCKTETSKTTAKDGVFITYNFYFGVRLR